MYAIRSYYENNAEQSIHFQTEASLAAEEENLTENKLDSEQTNFAGTKFSSKIWQIMLIIIPIISLTAIILTTVGFLSEKYFTLYLVAIFSVITSYSIHYTKLYENISKVSIFMDDCRQQGIDVLGPDVNESFNRFTVNSKGQIRFGLSAVKGLGSYNFV